MKTNHNLKSNKTPERIQSEAQPFRVAIVQFAPVYLEKAASLAKAIQTHSSWRQYAESIG